MATKASTCRVEEVATAGSPTSRRTSWTWSVGVGPENSARGPDSGAALELRLAGIEPALELVADGHTVDHGCPVSP